MVAAPDDPAVRSAFERLTDEEKASIRDYLKANGRSLSEKFSLTMTPVRIDIVASYYSKHVVDTGSAIRHIKACCDEIKNTELYFYKNHDINIVLEEDAIDFLMEMIVESAFELKDVYPKLNNHFEHGLKLVREKTRAQPVLHQPACAAEPGRAHPHPDHDDTSPQGQTMIGISKLYCGTVEPSDALRYGRHSAQLPSHLLQFSADKKPVVVWNMTRRCNLRCVHCYAHATDQAEARANSRPCKARSLLDDLAAFGAPVVLFSGGEPLVRKDLPELAAYAVGKGMRAVISTNGTLITRGRSPARSRRSACPTSASAWTACRRSTTASGPCRAPSDAALDGIRNCQAAGIKVGLRFTINRFNVAGDPEHLRAARGHGHPAGVLLSPRLRRPRLGAGRRRTSTSTRRRQHRGPDHRPHPPPARRGQAQRGADRRQPCRRALRLPAHAEGGPRSRREVLELLQWNEGNSSGRGIGCVSWDGEVHADQFWRHYSFGNVTATARSPRSGGHLEPAHGRRSRRRKSMSRAAAPTAAGWTSAAATSACAPRPSPGTSGRRTRPAT